MNVSNVSEINIRISLKDVSDTAHTSQIDK